MAGRDVGIVCDALESRDATSQTDPPSNNAAAMVAAIHFNFAVVMRILAPFAISVLPPANAEFADAVAAPVAVAVNPLGGVRRT